MGGAPRFLCEAIDTEPHAPTEFDRQVDALRQIVALRGLMTVDELRRGIKEIPEAEYHRLGYYQRWTRAIAATLVRKGVVTEAELRARLPDQGG